MSKTKTKRELLQELLDLEDSIIEEVKETEGKTDDEAESVIDAEIITKQKKPRTEKQLQAFEKTKAIRDANFVKRKEERLKQEQEEKRIIEAKLIKKAISLKKKQIKKQSVLDEISDDDTPIEKIKELVPVLREQSNKPSLQIKFF